MVAVKASDAESALARLDPSRPIVLVFGPDAGLVAERAARAIVAALGDAARDPMSTIRLDGDAVAADPARLADEAYAIGLFGGRRAIRVRIGGRSIAAALEPILATPPSETLILLEAGDLRRGHALRETIEKHPRALAVACYADGPREIATLVDQELRAAGLGIDNDAREALLEQLGGDRLATRGELRKLVLYAHGAKRITLADVEAIVGDAGASALDDIVDSAFAGQPRGCEIGFARTVGAGTSPQAVLAIAVRTATTLHRLATLIAAGSTTQTVLNGLRPPLHFKRRATVERCLAIWEPDALKRVLIDLGEAAANARKQASLSEAIASRALLALASAATRQRKRGAR